MASETAHRPQTEDLGIDIAPENSSFWSQQFEDRDHQAFAALRREAPVAWTSAQGARRGFWSVAKHEDIKAVGRNPEVWSSAEGVLIQDYPDDLNRKVLSFIGMDDPEHKVLRGIVQQAFSPRHVRELEDWVNQITRELVDEMIEKGEGDFCGLFAKELPGRVFASFFGVEKGGEEQAVLMDAAEKWLAVDDPEVAQGRSPETVVREETDRIAEVAMAVADKRRDDPQDDLVSWVVKADYEGRQMDDWEIAAFFIMVASAANDTTRHATAHAVRLFTEQPDQLDLLKEDMDGRLDTCVDEVIRYSTPVLHFARTATEDTELHGAAIGTGERAVMWFCSGNRDEDEFDEPSRFDILRKPNDHLAFGGGGPHYCMGQFLARQMLGAGLREIYTRMPDIAVTGDPVLQVNNFMHGVSELPVRWTPSANS